MAVLISGGTGFVGLALAERIIAEGGDAILFGSRPPPDEMLECFPPDRIKVVLGDVRSRNDMRAACRSSPIDAAVHLAAVTAGPLTERNEPERVISVNVEGTATFLLVLAREIRPRRVVVASSAAVYGFAGPGADGRLAEEEARLAPAALYGISKLAAEQTALRLGAIHGLDVVAVRLGALYGPWEYRTGMRDLMSPQQQVLDCVDAGRDAVLPRPLSADWLYSRDAARGLMALVLAGRLGSRVFNLGGGDVFGLDQWCAGLAARRPGFAWRFATAGGESANIVSTLPQDRAPLDNGRLIRAMAFEPAYDLETGLDDYLAWRERPRLIEASPTA